ncbi:tachykinin-like peptides receptor 99D [Actinia tenebrosa]|uniref:Tachykinin-like peptides receptor 99D n=1 Tax=Actinia tenebrosa TaxID=6105 RepID=A0A6P8H5Y6_ACTTE|nr:tachykinin-like peptides receptor 99D [Actinia tenebrosa]XP_031550877.1 tachykinin-like peptides receptor 99D [Actinia tenebrosa]XP_031550878.1 tachykinin-like peptides receptor 99D [Actinia tenebrosa]
MASNDSFKPYSTENVDRILAPIYVGVIIFGVSGNAFVMAVIKNTRSMHTTTNFLLLNLAVADFLTLLWCLPYKVLIFVFDHPHGVAGDYLCKFFTSYNVTVITLTVSIFTLTVLSVERYRALLKPMHHHLRLELDTVCYAIAAIWICATGFMIPLFVVTQYVPEAQTCRVNWLSKKQEDLYSMCIMVFSIFAPITVTVICYLKIIKGLYFSNTICSAPAGPQQGTDLQEKRKIVKILLLVTSAFILCFLPYASFRIVVALADETNYEQYNRLQELREIFKFLSYTSSSFNPVIYTIQSSNYRAALKRLFIKSCYCGSNNNNMSNSIESITGELHTVPRQFSTNLPDNLNANKTG